MPRADHAWDFMATEAKVNESKRSADVAKEAVSELLELRRAVRFFLYAWDNSGDDTQGMSRVTADAIERMREKVPNA